MPQVRARGLGANLRITNFWQKRYYGRNVRDAEEFTVKRRYLHRNPVRRGLVKDAAEWPGLAFKITHEGAPSKLCLGGDFPACTL